MGGRIWMLAILLGLVVDLRVDGAWSHNEMQTLDQTNGSLARNNAKNIPSSLAEMDMEVDTPGWEADERWTQSEDRRIILEHEAVEGMKRYWKLGIAFGFVCGLAAFIMTLHIKVCKYAENRELAGGAIVTKSFLGNVIDPNPEDSEIPENKRHPRLKITDEDNDSDAESISGSNQTIDLKGGGQVVSATTVMYTGVKIGMGSLVMMGLVQSPLIGCYAATVIILGVSAILTIMEGLMAISWAYFYTDDVINGLRTPCQVTLFVFTFGLIHLVLNSVGTSFAYDPPDDHHTCSINLSAQVFFTVSLILMVLDFYVTSKILGIVTRLEISPFTCLGYWKY